MNDYLIAASVAIAATPIAGGAWLLWRARKRRDEAAMHARFERETRGYVHRGEGILPVALVADAGSVDAGSCDGGSSCSALD
ncbi:hypothetical protein [Acidovorax sp. NCPPB 3576]|uniref:hypothetical protein n=1 Tax=Acidovorax sp. NCPPB 3576 TaxID=2940488 RepID=UPI00234BD222|nr:hypothetical protein [Acidovorax sp. NCPPB 3576]WCM88833.1 hypothetical protein M5C98_01910 [Acidovorax sp. NCPPB 3576]